MESIFSKEFDIHNKEKTWRDIYKQKLLDMNIVKIREFNFKILHNIVPCGNILSKWKENIKKECDLCQEVETTKHMLFVICVFIK